MNHLFEYLDHNLYLSNMSQYNIPWVVYDGEHVHYSNSTELPNSGNYKLGQIITYKGHNCICVIPSNCVPDQMARFLVFDWHKNSNWFSVSNIAVDIPSQYLNKYTELPNIQTCTSSEFNDWLDSHTDNDANTITNNVESGLLPYDVTTEESIIGKNLINFNSPGDQSYHRVNPNDVATAWDVFNGIRSHLPSPYINKTNNKTHVGDVMLFNSDVFNYPGTALANFNGLEDTKGILNYYYNTNVNTWTGNSSGSYQKSDYQVAAKILNDELNNGTTDLNNVEFYIPSIGELSFFICRQQFINDTIKAFDSNFTWYGGWQLWSSTQYDSSNVYEYNTGSYICPSYKYRTCLIPAFIKL